MLRKSHATYCCTIPRRPRSAEPRHCNIASHRRIFPTMKNRPRCVAKSSTFHRISPYIHSRNGLLGQYPQPQQNRALLFPGKARPAAWGTSLPSTLATHRLGKYLPPRHLATSPGSHSIEGSARHATSRPGVYLHRDLRASRLRHSPLPASRLPAPRNHATRQTLTHPPSPNVAQVQNIGNTSGSEHG